MNANSAQLQHFGFDALKAGRVVEWVFRVYTGRIEVWLTDVNDSLAWRRLDAIAIDES